MAAGGHLGFQKIQFLGYIPIGGTEWVIPEKFGEFRTNQFNVIVIFVYFNWNPAAIFDFAKFHF